MPKMKVDKIFDHAHNLPGSEWVKHVVKAEASVHLVPTDPTV